MELSKLKEFEISPIIAAVHSEKDFMIALDAEPMIIFDLNPNITTVSRMARAAHERGKKLFLHMDLAKGIGKDPYGVAYVRDNGADGIISTKSSMIKMANEAGMLTVQRFFIIDTQSVKTTIEAIAASKVDMIEIMPGICPKVIRKLKEKVSVGIIAGGLIDTKTEIIDCLAAGAIAISTGASALWNA